MEHGTIPQEVYMNNKIFIGLVVLSAGVLVGWYMLKGQPAPAVDTGAVVQELTPAGSNLGAPGMFQGSGSGGVEKGGTQTRSVVTLTSAGFAPNPITVKTGTTVTFVNESSGAMWVASDPHPSHSILPEFDAKASMSRGSTYEYTFTKVGTWTYHNHLNPSAKGTVVVTE